MLSSLGCFVMSTQERIFDVSTSSSAVFFHIAVFFWFELFTSEEVGSMDVETSKISSQVNVSIPPKLNISSTGN
jgi:hypothetical protein